MTAARVGRALCIGIGGAEAACYGGTDKLLGAEADAAAISRIARQQGFREVTLLLTADATRYAVLSGIHSAARQSLPGDLFLLSFAGHGGQIPEYVPNGARAREPDGLSETWHLFDGWLVDEEIEAALATFRPGVRVLIVSDSCHSGGMVPVIQGGGVAAGASPISKLNASVLLLGACLENELAHNGRFTAALLKVWNEGAFAGDYLAFHAALVGQVLPDQRPTLAWASSVDPSFESQRPFTI